MPADLTVGQFVYVVRKRIKLGPEKAIFIFVKNILPPTGEIKVSIVVFFLLFQYLIYDILRQYNQVTLLFCCSGYAVCNLRGK